MDLIKRRRFCPAQEAANLVKKKREMAEILCQLTKKTPDRGLISKIEKKEEKRVKETKWVMDLNREFSEDMKIAKIQKGEKKNVLLILSNKENAN